jgi:hypothetical protein
MSRLQIVQVQLPFGDVFKLEAWTDILLMRARAREQLAGRWSDQRVTSDKTTVTIFIFNSSIYARDSRAGFVGQPIVLHGERYERVLF